MIRKKGISTLLSCQNEEITVGWSILSFLEFSDEIIVVDNGSTDSTKDICREMAGRFPEKIRFYDVPGLRDLYESRQYALERSSYEWIVRADADYVCYTDGTYSCLTLRRHLLNEEKRFRPKIIYVSQPSLRGDLWHTNNSNAITHAPMQSHMARVYRWWPGIRFTRLGRWEGVRYGRIGRRLLQKEKWPHPVWMHCDVKSDWNYFMRAHRTDWRELGDYARFPTLLDYVKSITMETYGTNDLAVARRRHVEGNVLPGLVKYDVNEYYPVPALVKAARETNPGYIVERRSDGRNCRRSTTGPGVEALVTQLEKNYRPAGGPCSHRRMG